MARRPSSVSKLLRKPLLLADTWPDRYQTFTRWTPGQRASRVCSRSRSRSKVAWYAHFLGFLEWATPSLTVWFSSSFRPLALPFLLHYHGLFASKKRIRLFTSVWTLFLTKEPGRHTVLVNFSVITRVCWFVGSWRSLWLFEQYKPDIHEICHRSVPNVIFRSRSRFKVICFVHDHQPRRWQDVNKYACPKYVKLSRSGHRTGWVWIWVKSIRTAVLLPPPKEVMFLVWSVRLSVRRITEKVVDGFWRNFLEGRAWPRGQWVQFWWRSGSLSGSRSPKSDIRIHWII